MILQFRSGKSSFRFRVFRPSDGAGWAAWDCARSAHPDSRIRDRIAMMGGAWENKVGRTILERMCPGEAERKAAHRLLSNPEVGMDDILEPHLEAAAERGRREFCYC